MENMLGLLIAGGAFSALIGHWLMELREIARQDLPGGHRHLNKPGNT